MADEVMGSVEQEAASAQADMPQPAEAPEASPVVPQGQKVEAPRFESFEAAAPGAQNGVDKLHLLMDVPLRVSVELGRTRLSVREVLDLQEGSVVELHRAAGEPVDVYVNDRLVARGEVVVVDDCFAVRITELLPPGDRNGGGG